MNFVAYVPWFIGVKNVSIEFVVFFVPKSSLEQILIIEQDRIMLMIPAVIWPVFYTLIALIYTSLLAADVYDYIWKYRGTNWRHRRWNNSMYHLASIIFASLNIGSNSLFFAIIIIIDILFFIYSNGRTCNCHKLFILHGRNQ